MTDFWRQFSDYSEAVRDEASSAENPQRLLTKILAHTEQKRQSIEAQVSRSASIGSCAFANSSLFRLVQCELCVWQGEESLGDISAAEWNHDDE